MKNKKMPLISVIVAVFNAVDTIKKCIESVSMQTYPNKELIVIDGGSNDGTRELIKASGEKISYWISEKDHGIYHAFNKGIEKATGEWICFLGADDYFWESDVLAIASEQLKMLSPDIRIAYGRVMVVTAEGKEVCLLGEPWKQKENRLKQILLFMPHQGVIHRRSLFEKHGKFNESLRVIGDNELLLRELKTKNPAFLPNIISVMRQGGISTEVNNSLLVLRETKNVAKIHGLTLPRYYWFMTVTKAYIKLLLLNVLGKKSAIKILNFYSRFKRSQLFKGNK